VEASRLLHNPEVALRIGALRQAHAVRHEITLDRLTAMLLEDRRLAYERGHAGSAVSATMGLAKLHGHIIDRSENRNVAPKSIHDYTEEELLAIVLEAAEGKHDQ
jgi:phage terminase small subunit